MKEKLESLLKEIENVALAVVMLYPEDISGLGKALQSLEPIEELSGQLSDESLTSFILAIKEYIEAVIMGEKTDLSPLETGISRLQETCRTIGIYNMIAGEA